MEAQRIAERTNYDMEMLHGDRLLQGHRELLPSAVSGSRPGRRPIRCWTYFPEDFLLFVDESHVTLPQVRAMYNGDRARKQTTGGLRLPAAVARYDNRPLKFDEFSEERINQVSLSSRPHRGELEKEHRRTQVVEQVDPPHGSAGSRWWRSGPVDRPD